MTTEHDRAVRSKRCLYCKTQRAAKIFTITFIDDDKVKKAILLRLSLVCNEGKLKSGIYHLECVLCQPTKIIY